MGLIKVCYFFSKVIFLLTISLVAKADFTNPAPEYPAKIGAYCLMKDNAAKYCSSKTYPEASGSASHDYTKPFNGLNLVGKDCDISGAGEGYSTDSLLKYSIDDANLYYHKYGWSKVHWSVDAVRGYIICTKMGTLECGKYEGSEKDYCDHYCPDPTSPFAPAREKYLKTFKAVDERIFENVDVNSNPDLPLEVMIGCSNDMWDYDLCAGYELKFFKIPPTDCSFPENS